METAAHRPFRRTAGPRLVTSQRRLRLEQLGAWMMVCVGALAIGLWHPGERSTFWQGIEGRLLDARFLVRGPSPPAQQVAIVAVDDATVAKLAAFPPSRAALGAIVAGAADAGVQALAMDFLLVDPRADDALLAAALSRARSIIGVAEAAAGTSAPALHTRHGVALVTGREPVSPLPALGPTVALQDAAALGHVTVEPGPDGVLRRMRPVLALATADGVVHVSGLAVAAVAVQAGPVRYQAPTSRVGGHLDIGSISLPLDLRGNVVLDYYGPAGTIPTYSAASLAEADLRGKLVVVGATATGFGDRHATPFDATLPGVEVHATFAANLLAGRHLRRDAVAWAASVATAVLAAMAGLAATGFTRLVVAILAVILVAATVAAVLQLAFLAGWWLDASTAILALGLGAAVGVAAQQFNLRRRATNLARYQSPALVEALATSAKPLQNRPPQPAVVLFVDVTNFTTHAERHGPQRTHAFLALFTRLVEEAADHSSGLIADFAGDGALVVFGVPDPGTDDTERALGFIDKLYTTVSDCADWPGLKLRVSGHAGPVQLGILGGERHRRVAISGDVVNTASRLLDCARSNHTSLALSGALVTGSGATRQWAAKRGLRELEPQLLRGRITAEQVWVGEPSTAGRGHSAPA
jgi:adenylate cyclase